MSKGYSDRYNIALCLAAQAHAAQRRKGRDTPYIIHPVHVARILDRHDFGEDLVVAALLHDALEDTAIGEADIEAALGAYVLSLVRAVTERKSEEGVERPWEVRKAEQLSILRQAGADVSALKAADLLHNVQETLEDARRRGVEAAFRKFKRGPHASLRHYMEVSRVVGARLGERHRLSIELRDSVNALAELAGMGAAVEPEARVETAQASGS